MTAERSIATLVSATGYSLTTVRRWWLHRTVRKRTSDDLQHAATENGLRRPRRPTP